MQILVNILLTLIGFLLIFGLIFVLIGKDVCKILGHDWEEVRYEQEPHETYTKVTRVLRCRNCHQELKETREWHVPEPDYEPGF